jgi:hypothetical protein
MLAQSHSRSSSDPVFRGGHVSGWDGEWAEAVVVVTRRSPVYEATVAAICGVEPLTDVVRRGWDH